jgi:hypothetical protein
MWYLTGLKLYSLFNTLPLIPLIPFNNNKRYKYKRGSTEKDIGNEWWYWD